MWKLLCLVSLTWSLIITVDSYARKQEKTNEDMYRRNRNRNQNVNQFSQRTDYTVEHCLSLPNEKDIWNERGRLIIDHTSRSGSLSMHEWTDEEMEQWEELTRKNGFYRLRIKIDDSNIYGLNNTLYSSVRACALTGRSEEKIRLHCDGNGYLTSFDYDSSNNGKLCKKSSKLSLPKTFLKSAEVSMSFGSQGERPFTPDYESNPKPKQEQSFWSKYWWIILIVGFMLMSQLAQGAAGAQ